MSDGIVRATGTTNGGTSSAPPGDELAQPRVFRLVPER